jgi:hypothetical protein
VFLRHASAANQLASSPASGRILGPVASSLRDNLPWRCDQAESNHGKPLTGGREGSPRGRAAAFPRSTVAATACQSFDRSCRPQPSSLCRIGHPPFSDISVHVVETQAFAFRVGFEFFIWVLARSSPSSISTVAVTTLAVERQCSATRRTGRVDCNHDAHAGLAAAHGQAHDEVMPSCRRSCRTRRRVTSSPVVDAQMVDSCGSKTSQWMSAESSSTVQRSSGSREALRQLRQRNRLCLLGGGRSKSRSYSREWA